MDESYGSQGATELDGMVFLQVRARCAALQVGRSIEIPDDIQLRSFT